MTYVLYAALFLNPLLAAGASITMRKMKKFHDAVVSWYVNLGILISSLIVILAMGSGFTVIGNFDWQTWLLSAATGLTVFLYISFNFMALKL